MRQHCGEQPADASGSQHGGPQRGETCIVRAYSTACCTFCARSRLGQAGCVATWQLLTAGWSRDAVRHRTRGLRRLHDGVFVTGDAPVTRLQRWWAATLTAPGSVLAFASAAAAYEMRPREGAFEVIVRQGSGGPQRYEALLVCRTKHVHA